MTTIPQNQKAKTRGVRKPKQGIEVAAYLETLEHLGYTKIALNQVTGQIEVNGSPMSDFVQAEITTRMMAEGFSITGIEKNLIAEAGRNVYHPIREYLIRAAFDYDGGQHIEKLTSYFTDKTEPHPLFSVFLRKWLIGAVAKVFDSTNQNPMLVLSGPQNSGKSYFARWICPLPNYFVESPIDPNSKDSRLRLTSAWIWEVGELDATTRRADAAALKNFITLGDVTERRPYGKNDVKLPALASFVGTVNNAGGFLMDSTGNRRFWVSEIGALDWNYAKDIDPRMVWAEAYVAYSRGETGKLTPLEYAMSEENNEKFEISDPIEGYITKYFDIDPSDLTAWLPTHEIVDQIQSGGYRHSSTHVISIQISRVLARMGCQKERRSINGRQSWGWTGIKTTHPANRVMP